MSKMTEDQLWSECLHESLDKARAEGQRVFSFKQVDALVVKKCVAMAHKYSQ